MELMGTIADKFSIMSAVFYHVNLENGHHE